MRWCWWGWWWCIAGKAWGGEIVAVEVVKKERLGLMGMGVPSSSNGVGGIVVEWDAEPRSLLVRGGVCVALALFMLELEERV